MDFVAEGVLGVRQLASGNDAALAGNGAAEECGSLRSSTSSSAGDEHCEGCIAKLMGQGHKPQGESSAAVSASSDKFS